MPRTKKSSKCLFFVSMTAELPDHQKFYKKYCTYKANYLARAKNKHNVYTSGKSTSV